MDLVKNPLFILFVWALQTPIAYKMIAYSYNKFIKTTK